MNEKFVLVAAKFNYLKVDCIQCLWTLSSWFLHLSSSSSVTQQIKPNIMLISSLLTHILLFFSSLRFSVARPATFDVPSANSGLQKRTLVQSSCATNGCPNLDFSWRSNQQSIMKYYLDVTSVSWIEKILTRSLYMLLVRKKFRLNSYGP